MRDVLLALLLLVVTERFVLADGSCEGTLGTPGTCSAGYYINDSSNDICPPGRYCTGNGLAECCPENFPNSTEGISGDGDCYAQCASSSDNYSNYTSNCGFAYGNYTNDFLVVSCINSDNTLSMWEPDENYHIEALGGNSYGCYLNNRPCKNFTTVDRDPDISLNQNSNRETAIWDTDYNTGYDITNCRHALDENDTERAHCQRRTFYKPYPRSTTRLPNAQSALTFETGNITDTNNYDKYFCISCENGSYYPVVDTLTSIHHCLEPGTGYFKACQCKLIPQGFFNSTSAVWDNSQPILTNPYSPCPAGKTTNAPGGATSIQGCHFGSETQICDNGGCKPLSDLDNLSNWTDL